MSGTFCDCASVTSVIDTVEHAIAHCNRDVDDVRSLTIHAARKHRVAGRRLHRHTLAGERCLIHAGPAFMRCSV